MYLYTERLTKEEEIEKSPAFLMLASLINMALFSYFPNIFSMIEQKHY